MVAANDRERLSLLASDEFDPQAEAYVEVDLRLGGDCAGQAQIVSETPTRLEIAVDMQTAGLVVASEMWDPGWQARLNDSQTEVLRVDHALCGAVVPAGHSRLVLCYEPDSFWLGLRLSCAALVLLALWLAAARERPRQLGSA